MDRAGWLGLLFLLTWIAGMCGLAMLTSRVSSRFMEQVTVPHCQEACGDAGAPFERFRIHVKNGPAEACLCRGGIAVAPALLKGTVPPTFAAIIAMILGGIAGMIGLAHLYGWLQRLFDRRDDAPR